MIEWFARNSVAANLLMVGIICAGFFSLQQIPLQTFPVVEPREISVDVRLRGATPEDMERGVTVRIEEALADLVGVEQIVSTSIENRSLVRVEAEEGTNPRDLLNDIKNRVDSINTFPADAERPVVSLAQRLHSVIDVVVSGPYSELEIRAYTEKVREDLLRETAVTSAELSADRPYVIAIEASQDKLREFDMTLADITRAIDRSSLDVSAGNVFTEGGEVLIRSKGQAYTKSDFDDVTLKTNADGSILRVSDVAVVIDGFREDATIAEFDGGFAGLIEVRRTGKQGAIEIADEVKAYIEEQTPLLPVGMELSYWDDDSEALRQRLGTLGWNMLTGGCLVIALLALLLRPAVSFWVFLGIPISFLGSFIILNGFGLPINMLTLFGYILVLGIVVDDAIVTGESIYASLGSAKSGVDAAIYGTKRVAVPVTFGVVTTMAAFVPMLFLEGRIGSFMAPIPIVVISVLIFSLIESKFVLPAHLKHLSPSRSGENMSRFSRWQYQFSTGFENFVIRHYRPILDACVRNRYTVLSVFIGVFLIILVMLITGHSKYQPFPRVPSNSAIFSVDMPEGTAFSVMNRHMVRISEEAQKLREKHKTADGEYALKHTLTIFRNDVGTVEIETDPQLMEEIGYTTRALTQDWRKAVGEITGAETVSIRAERFRTGDPVNVRLIGSSFEELSGAAALVAERLSTYDNVYNISDSLSDGKEELQIEINQQGYVLGLTRLDVLSQISQAFQGMEAQRIQRGRNDVLVVVRLPRSERSTVSTLNEFLIVTPSGQRVPLRQVADIVPGKGPSAIRRIDHFRVVEVTAEYDKEKVNATSLNNELGEYLEELSSLYPNIDHRLSGEAEQQVRFFQNLSKTLTLLLLVMYCLLALPLKSYVQPLIIMSVIPFSIIGAVLGHTIMGQTMSMLSILGILALIGVVVNDSLVLVDYINQARSSGLSLKEATLNAGAARFRAVMLTSVTTFFGLMPMMFATNIQSTFLVPMAISLGYGIIFGTLITLILVPSFMMMYDDIRRFFSSSGIEDLSDDKVQEAGV